MAQYCPGSSTGSRLARVPATLSRGRVMEGADGTASAVLPGLPGLPPTQRVMSRYFSRTTPELGRTHVLAYIASQRELKRSDPTALLYSCRPAIDIDIPARLHIHMHLEPHVFTRHGGGKLVRHPALFSQRRWLIVRRT